jgi:hypothetical protein
MPKLQLRTPLGLLAVALALMSGGIARADIIPNFNAADPSDNGCTFSYSVEITANSKVFTGDYFTIYDFNGYVSGTEFAPADWDVDVQLLGTDVSGQTGIFDDPGVYNLTFTYVGASTILGPVNPVGGVGAFGADSVSCDVKGLGQYAGYSHKQNPGHPDNNTPQGNQGYVVTPAAVPEASSLMLLVPGLAPLGIALRRRVARK